MVKKLEEYKKKEKIDDLEEVLEKAKVCAVSQTRAFCENDCYDAPCPCYDSTPCYDRPS